MKNVDLDRVLMWRNLHQYLQTQDAHWRHNAPFAGADYGLSQAIAQIDDAIQEQKRNTTGVTAQRRSLRADAVARVTVIARCAEAFAASTGDAKLFEAVHVQPSRLLVQKNSEQAAVMITVLDAAKVYSAELVPYGITEAHFTEAYAVVHALQNMIHRSRSAITDRAGITRRIKVIMAEGMAAVMQLDRIMKVIAQDVPEFGIGYKAARVVTHTISKRSRAGSAPAA